MQKMKIILGVALVCLLAKEALGQECTWRTSNGVAMVSGLVDNVLECGDGTTCKADDNDHANGNWDCCANKGGRAKCPPNYPNMCANPVGCQDDYCCEKDCSDQGGNRPGC